MTKKLGTYYKRLEKIYFSLNEEIETLESKEEINAIEKCKKNIENALESIVDYSIE